MPHLEPAPQQENPRLIRAQHLDQFAPQDAVSGGGLQRDTLLIQPQRTGGGIKLQPAQKLAHGGAAATVQQPGRAKVGAQGQQGCLHGRTLWCAYPYHQLISLFDKHDFRPPRQGFCEPLHFHLLSIP